MTAEDLAPELPAFRTHLFGPRRTRHAVVIPVLNEGERIRRQLARMAGGPCDLVIVDGGSRDGSEDPEQARRAGVRALLVKEGPGRLSAQIRIGLAWCMAEGYEGVVLIDGNDKDDPAAIPAFVERLDAGWDHVQGSRFLPGGRAVNNPRIRIAGLRLVHAPCVSLAARHRYTDTTNGFRAYSRRLLEHPAVQPYRAVFVGYELHYYLAIRAARVGLRVCEIPVVRTYPAGEPVPSKIKGLRGNLEVLKTLFRTCLGAYDPARETGSAP